MLTSSEDSHSTLLVSVVLPTFNRASLLQRAMASVLNQDYYELELIVVRYCRLEEQRGAASARNAGIGIARGSLIAFQDSDDEWLPGKLRKQVDAIAAGGDSLEFVYTSFWREREGLRERVPSPSQISRHGNTFERLLRGNFIGMPTLMVTRSLVKSAGTFDETMQSLEDWDLVLRFSRVTEGLFIDEPLVLVHESSSGANSQVASCYLRSLEVIRCKHAPEFHRHRRADSEMYLAKATASCRGTGLRSWQASVSQCALACVRDPSNAKAWVLLAVSLTGPRSVVRLRSLRHRFASGSTSST
jgi:GT2 family glycosyltransferase